MTYRQWLIEVLQYLCDENGRPKPLFLASLEHPDNPMKFEDFMSDPVEAFKKFRGDEPMDVYDPPPAIPSQTPEQYASFLYSEWELFGPGGE